MNGHFYIHIIQITFSLAYNEKEKKHNNVRMNDEQKTTENTSKIGHS